MLISWKLGAMASFSRSRRGSVMKPGFEHISISFQSLDVLNHYAHLAFKFSLPALPGKMVNTWPGLNKFFCIY